VDGQRVLCEPRGALVVEARLRRAGALENRRDGFRALLRQAVLFFLLPRSTLLLLNLREQGLVLDVGRVELGGRRDEVARLLKLSARELRPRVLDDAPGLLRARLRLDPLLHRGAGQPRYFAREHVARIDADRTPANLHRLAP